MKGFASRHLSGVIYGISLSVASGFKRSEKIGAKFGSKHPPITLALKRQTQVETQASAYADSFSQVANSCAAAISKSLLLIYWERVEVSAQAVHVRDNTYGYSRSQYLRVNYLWVTFCEPCGHG